VPISHNSNNDANTPQIAVKTISVTPVRSSGIGSPTGLSIVADLHVQNRDEFTTGIAQTVRTAGIPADFCSENRAREPAEIVPVNMFSRVQP
jgi:hypothetical protein